MRHAGGRHRVPRHVWRDAGCERRGEPQLGGALQSSASLTSAHRGRDRAKPCQDGSGHVTSRRPFPASLPPTHPRARRRRAAARLPWPRCCAACGPRPGRWRSRSRPTSPAGLSIVESAVVYRGPDGGVRAFSARCTHLGCRIDRVARRRGGVPVPRLALPGGRHGRRRPRVAAAGAPARRGRPGVRRVDRACVLSAGHPHASSRTRWGTLGDLATAAFVVAAASGVVVAVPYDPADAYGSIAAILLANPAASFFRNAHYWAGQLCLVLTPAARVGPPAREDRGARRAPAPGCGWRSRLPLLAFIMLSGFMLRGDPEGRQALRILTEATSQVPIVGPAAGDVRLRSGRAARPRLHAARGDGDDRRLALHHRARPQGLAPRDRPSSP